MLYVGLSFSYFSGLQFLVNLCIFASVFFGLVWTVQFRVV